MFCDFLGFSAYAWSRPSSWRVQRLEPVSPAEVLCSGPRGTCSRLRLLGEVKPETNTGFFSFSSSPVYPVLSDCFRERFQLCSYQKQIHCI